MSVEKPKSELVFIPMEHVAIPEQDNITASGSTSPANTAMQQAEKPIAPKSGNDELIRNIAGHALLAVGFSVGAAMFAVIVPLGLLGAGVGFAIGKGVEKLVKDAPKDAGKTGAKIGGSIGSLLTAAAIMTGLKLIKKDRNEGITITDNPPEAHPLKFATIAMMDDGTAESKIKGLSQESRKTLLALFDGQFMPKNKLNILDQELNQNTVKESSVFSDVSHSVQNKLASRISSSDVIEQLRAKLNAPALTSLDATYETDGKGILDIAYANASTGTLYVVDGTGHNNPTMAKALKNVFDPFTANYQTAIQEKKFGSVDECQTFVIDQLKQLRTTLANSQDPVYPEGSAVLGGGQIPNNLGWDQFAPIGSLAQIVNIDGKQHLVHVKNGDMMLVIKKKTGDIVFGDVKLGRNSTLGSGPLRAEIIEVEPGDQIMLMTDGIGEYLPKENLEAVIKNNTHPQLLKDELKNAVIAYGLNNSKTEENAHTLAANGSDLHYHNPQDEKNYDDVGFSWLQVQEE